MKESDYKNKLNSDWWPYLKDFLLSGTADWIFSQVKKKAKHNKVIPISSKVFNTFNNCPFQNLKVVILGQDPYPNENDARGSAFSAGDPIHVPKSLANILREVDRDTDNIGEWNTDLSRWEKQGVLLLNTSLTVNEGEPGSHKGIWEPFINHVFEVINIYHSGIIFMLWGNHAKSYKSKIGNQHYILEASHPSPLSANRGKEPFSGCSHFTRANEIIEQLNGKEYVIEW